MLAINQIKLLPERIKDKDSNEILLMLRKKASEILRCDENKISDIKILKRSIDARKKPEVYYSYSVCVGVRDEEKLLRRCTSKNVIKHSPKTFSVSPLFSNHFTSRPVVVGFGPAGIAASYTLAKLGANPIVLERGSSVEKRKASVKRFWERGELNYSTNVQFGEGGAGAFSDGKLNTGNKDKDGLKSRVLKELCEHGAPEEILYEAMPHVGTDLLVDIVKNFRTHITKMGGEFLFDTCLKEIEFDSSGKVCGILVCSEGKSYRIDTDYLVLAIGHSARDTFEYLNKTNVLLEAKPFAVGYRVAHLQSFINESRYGKGWDEKGLPPSYYKLTHTLPSGRSIYSFCMCPGGYIVNASSNGKMLCINGMSYSKRDGKYANSAIVMSVTPKEIPALLKDMDGVDEKTLCYLDNPDSLVGMYFQNEIEKKAYKIGEGKIPFTVFGGNTKAVIDDNNDMNKIFRGNACCIEEMIEKNLILPDALNKDFLDGMDAFSNIISGFNESQRVVAGVESRTSSPVRIVRDASGNAVGCKGLYPCGEGAGYAGGIMSAAMDGVRIILNTL